MQRRDILKEMDYVMETYCEDCFLRHHFRRTYGKTYAHRFCIQHCTVGENLKKIGQTLSNYY
ncbi:zinc-finger domain-containing protein [Lederbergia sp. NSJ-179]|uniref:zinc-finger domain-containing protein n=1 Tax=Lederbergia sp. NSJ-179 TaxID=2931402 RepID=UPI001FCF95F6|nr:zinc-finger domain-containing protein [Lederbergia sp. NSJ-179]MCJ7839512.1 zinc-finger domain-containing protein [Lederbergia sp. NSJ-179]